MLKAHIPGAGHALEAGTGDRPAQAHDGDAGGIGWAVYEMRRGKRVRRVGWNGKGMWLEHVHHSTVSGIRSTGASVVHDLDPFVVMRTAHGTYVPWLCSQTDLLATDWEIAE